MNIVNFDEYSSLNANLSIMHVRASELYPKKCMVETDETASLAPPFTTLCGESIEYLGRTSEGVLAVSNYRLYHQRSADGKGDLNIPLGLVDSIEMRDLFHIYISCKDARTCRCSFSTNDVCMEWFRRLFRSVTPPKNIEEFFAFVYYAWACEEGGEEVMSYLGARESCVPKDTFKSELERLKFNTEVISGCWRVSSVNQDYQLCSSYPKYLIVPSKITDQTLETAARFRSSRRVPAIVWRHKENGMVIARSSQPEVGWLGWRSNEDEELLKAILESCTQSAATLSRVPKKQKLVVMDARSYTTAVANRARGGGCECPDYYPTCEMLYMNLANIHAIRKSFIALRQLCASSADQSNWHSLLDATSWLQHMSLVIQAAVRVVTALEKDIQPVLVHCSDGWDRTSQIVSLAELLLDPYYRTIEGFQILVEREWLDFGHKFADRCFGEDVNEKCPVFLQWLDCVQNILHQFPCAFEFSRRYLIKLAEHTYSNLFGTFLCNTSAERLQHNIANRTFSVWKYLSSPHFRNYLYNPNYEKILWPRFATRDLEVWRDLYIDLFSESNQIISSAANHKNSVGAGTLSGDVNESVITDRESENGNLHNFGNNIGPMLESAINCQPEEMSDTSSPKSNGFDKLHDRFASDRSVSQDDEDEEEESLTKSDSTVKFNEVEADTPTLTVECTEDYTDLVQGETNELMNGSAVNGVKEDLNLIDSEFYSSEKKDSDFSLESSEKKEKYSRGVVDTLLNTSEDSVAMELEKCLKLNTQDTDIVTATSNQDFFDAYKTCPRKSSNPLPYNTARFPNPGILCLDPIDGLPLIPDDVQDRMQQISIENKARTAALETELHTTRISLLKAVCHQCSHSNMNGQAATAIAEKLTILDDDKGSVSSTEVSWEAIEEKETQPTLWMPDHAVSQCMNCDNKFWLGRRKHHCRSCGKIFCADCSQNLIPLPNEQLYEPVRVCESCFRTSSSIIYSMSPKQTTCKQAAGEEPQNSNPVLPPTPPI